MPNLSIPTLMQIAAKKVADDLNNLPFAAFVNLSMDSKAEVLKQLKLDQLFNFWQAHYHEDEELAALGFELLLKVSNKELLNVLHKLLPEKELLQKKKLLKLDVYVVLDDLDKLILDSSTSVEIKMLALASKLMLMQSYSYNPEKHDFILTVEKLVILGELSDKAPLRLLAKTLLAKLTHSSSIYSSVDHLVQTTSLKIKKKNFNEDLGVLISAFPYLNYRQREVVFSLILTGFPTNKKWTSTITAQDCTRLFPLLSNEQRSMVLKKLLACLYNDWKMWGLSEICATLLPYLNDTQRQDLLAALWPCLESKNDTLYLSALNIFFVLLPQVDKDVRNKLFITLLNRLPQQDNNALRACAAFFDYLSSDQREQLLTYLFLCFQEGFKSQLPSAISSIGFLFLYLNEEQREAVLTSFLSLSHNENLLVTEEAVRQSGEIFSHLTENQRERVVASLLVCLQHEKIGVRSGVFKTCIAIYPLLIESDCEKIFSILCTRLQGNNDEVQVATCRVLVNLFPSLNEVQREIIVIQMLGYWSDCFSSYRLIEMSDSLFPHLNGDQLDRVFTKICDYFSPTSSCFLVNRGIDLGVGLFPFLNETQRQVLFVQLLADLSKRAPVLLDKLNAIGKLVDFLHPYQCRQIFVKLVDCFIAFYAGNEDRTGAKHVFVKASIVLFPKLNASMQQYVLDRVIECSNKEVAMVIPYLNDAQCQWIKEKVEELHDVASFRKLSSAVINTQQEIRDDVSPPSQAFFRGTNQRYIESTQKSGILKTCALM